MPKLPLATPRNRIINFRLTEQEYSQLRSACTEQGSRCLSDFARAAVLSYAQTNAPGALQSRLLTLDERLSALGGSVGRLVQLLDK